MEARRRSPEPLLAWPGRDSLRLSVPLSSLFAAIFFSVYGLASLASAGREVRPAFHFDWELGLPFVPAAAMVYLTVPLVLAWAPFILRTWREFLPFFLTLTAETLAAGLVFLLAPVAQAYPERVASGAWAGAFQIADRLNLEHNEVPSLHVAFAVTAALVFGRRCGWLGRSLFGLWAAAVGVSALLMHEHHFVDLAAGAVLGFAAVGLIHDRVERETALWALRIDGLCLREMFHFTRRHPRYLLVGLALVRASIPRWRETRPLRAAYCLAQHVDDVLDGDRAIPGDPGVYVGRVLKILQGKAPSGGSAVDGLAEFLAADMSSEVRGELVELFEVLLEDRRRMDARRAMPAAELAEHHRKTFFYSFDLTFLLSGAELRAGDAPELIDALSWVSPIRDLRQDWEKGLINVPLEVLEQADGGGDPLEAPAVREWLRAEHARGAAAIEALGRRLESVRERRGRAVIVAFHKALVAYEKKYRRRMA